MHEQVPERDQLRSRAIHPRNRQGIADADRVDDAAIAQAAIRWVGTPWAHQGRTGEGCDCVGFLIGLAADLGFECADDRTYGRPPEPSRLLEMLSLNGCERVSGGAADQLPRDGREEIARAVKPGRVLVFGYSAGKPQHVAVATAHGFVHAIERQGRYDSGVESRGWSQSWTRRLHSVWRFTRWQR